jgi:hypothetical protein
VRANSRVLEEVSIPFVNYGGILDWRVEGNNTLSIQGLNGQRYRARLMGSCFDLPFAESIGFKALPSGQLGRFGAILVRDQQCPVTSLVKIDAPPPKITQVPTSGRGPRK